MEEESDHEERQGLLGQDRTNRGQRRDQRLNMDNVDFDEVLIEINGFGKYQKTFYFLLCLPAMFTATITLSNTFVTAEPKTRCDIPLCDDKLMPQYDDAFVSPHYFANYTIPKTGNDMQFSSCQYYKPTINTTQIRLSQKRSEQTLVPTTTAFLNNVADPRMSRCDSSHFNQSVRLDCTKYVYDQSIYRSTVVSEWNLVCRESWKVPMIESVFFAGVMVGAPLFGILADKYGRRPILMISILVTTLFGIPLGLAPNYTIFLILQFFVAIGQLGIFQTCFIMAVELVAKERRVLCGIVIEYFFDVGAIFLAAVAYVLRDWQHILLVATCPVSLFLTYWPILPESVRWLLVNKKYSEAKREIYRISKWNGRFISASRFENVTEYGIPGTSNVSFFENNQMSDTPTNDAEDVHETFGNSRVAIRSSPSDRNRRISNEPENVVTRTEATETFITFLSNPVMLARHINVCYCWLVVTLVYYGLSMVSCYLSKLV